MYELLRSRTFCQLFFFIERGRMCPELPPPPAPPPPKPKKNNVPHKNVTASGNHMKGEATAKQTAGGTNKQPPATLPKPTTRAASRSTGKCG